MSENTNPVGAVATKEEDEANNKETTEALIAQAAAAAVEAASVDIDATAAALAVDATKNKPRKRYREEGDDVSHENEELKDSEGDKGSGVSSHEDQLAARRMKDRQRYANMTPEQRKIYNAKRREQYHRQSEISRQKRRERERNRYHSLENSDAKDRNQRRAKLERERYQKLTPQELEIKNRKRRERAALARQKKEAAKHAGTVSDVAEVTSDKTKDESPAAVTVEAAAAAEVVVDEIVKPDEEVVSV